MIKLCNIDSGYGKKHILNGINLTLETSRLISVIGPNGSGKSTLLKTAAGIIKPFSGEIYIDGDPLSDISQTESAQKTAYLSQGKSVPDMTVSELVLLGRFPHLRFPKRYTTNDYKTAQSAILRMNLENHADKKLSSLSGGMRQNAYIAMALAQDTDHILLDEPTTYLDIAHQISLMNLLRTLRNESKCIVTVMHDLPLAFSFSDEIVLINNGKIVIKGTPEDVAESGAIKEIFGIGLVKSDYNEYRYIIKNQLK